MQGLDTDIDYAAQFAWVSHAGTNGLSPRSAAISRVTRGEHDGFYLVNRRIKATFEHPFLLRRDEAWGFCSAELLKVGDYLTTLVDGHLDEERIDAIERIDGMVRTVAIHVPGTNTYLAEGVWTHNDAKDPGPGLSNLSNSGPGISNSGGSTGPSISASVSSSGSSSSSGSKSSGSSFSSSSSIGVSNTGGTLSNSAAE